MTEIRLVTEATAIKAGYKVMPNMFWTNKKDALKTAQTFTRKNFKVLIARALRMKPYREGSINGYVIYLKKDNKRVWNKAANRTSSKVYYRTKKRVKRF